MLPGNDSHGPDNKPSNDQQDNPYHYQPNSINTSNSSSSGFLNSFARSRPQPNPYQQRNSRPYYQNNNNYNNNNNRFNYSYDNNNNNRNSNNYNSNDNFASRVTPSQTIEKPKNNSIKIERPNSTPITQTDIRKSNDNININIASRTSSHQVKVEHTSKTVTRSLSDEIKPETKIKVQKASQSENKSFIIASADAKSELCPFCGSISLPFFELINHIITLHKLSKVFEETFKAVQNPDLCSKCNSKVNEGQLLRHCLEKHKQTFFEMIRDKCINQFESHRSEIEVFIEKHEPSINPRYNRTASISSSNSSDNEEDTSLFDEDYERFAASSIDTSGLAAQKKVVHPEPKIDPSKIETNKREPKVQINKDIFLLADYEIFLRNYNLFTILPNSNSFMCNLCKQKYDSVIRLVVHSSQQHRLRISREMRKALCLMKKSVTYDMDESELYKMTGLNLDLPLRKCPSVAQAREAFLNTFLNDVPQAVSDMMLEILSFTQPVVRLHHTPKIFTDKTIILVRLPAPLPVFFSSEGPGLVSLGFIDTESLTADQILKTVQETLNCLFTHKIIDLFFKNIDGNRGFSDDDFSDLIEELDIQILKSDDHINPDGTRSFSIAVMIPKWSKATKKDIEREFSRLFDEAKMTLCKRCHQPYNIHDEQSECEGPKANGLTIKVKGKKHEQDRVISEYEINETELGVWNPEKRYTS